MTVTCPYCENDAVLVTGQTIYPHRLDLVNLKFWRCQPCGAYVGCHKQNKKHNLKGDEPLGRLANAELRKAKSRVHTAFDPKWKNGPMTRQESYAWLAGRLRIDPDQCHIGMFDLAMCDRAVSACGHDTGESSVSSCDNCDFADWDRTKAGRLHPNKVGRCKRLDVHPLNLKIPRAFYWLGGEATPLGGFILRGENYEEPCQLKSVT